MFAPKSSSPLSDAATATAFMTSISCRHFFAATAASAFLAANDFSTTAAA